MRRQVRAPSAYAPPLGIINLRGLKKISVAGVAGQREKAKLKMKNSKLWNSLFLNFSFYILNSLLRPRRSRRFFLSGALKITIPALLLTLALAVSSARAEADVKEGYDENTEITVRGRVIEAERPVRGPVIVTLKGRGRAFMVVTAPAWYLAQLGVSFSPGDRYEVSGSKYFGRDGRLYIVGRILRHLDSGRVTVLRDASSCSPLWMGPHRNRRP